MAFNKKTSDVVIAREDAIYSYSSGGRGPSYAFDSPKTSINVFREYVAVVCPPQNASKSDTIRRFGGNQVDDIFNTSTFTLLDTDMKFVAHSESLVSGVKKIFTEWGDLFLVTTDRKVRILSNVMDFTKSGQIYRYHEKSIHQKLEILYHRNLYILAINLAQRAGIDPFQQNVIFRKYGDYLYQKGDYDTAMQQYLRAIDNTEPSQVIRKVSIYSSKPHHTLLIFL